MNALKNRALAHETGFAIEDGHRFLASARRNKRLGQWAGEILRKSDIEAYAQEVVLAGLERKEGEFARLRRDFDAAGIAIGDLDIYRRMHALLDEVLEEMRSN